MPTAAPLPLAPQASAGFTNASAYDTHRPSYPSIAVSKFLAHLNVAQHAGAKIIDLGAGTGKFTELLAARSEDYDIVAVEPLQSMRAELEKKNLNAVRLLDGDARRMEVGDAWGDACIAAQAFHWFATPESLNEIHRVLKPGGAFGVIWNIEDYNSPKEWPAAHKFEDTMRSILFSLEDGHPRFRHMKWKNVFENQGNAEASHGLVAPSAMFSLPIKEEKVEWTVWLTEEKLWDRYSTMSQIVNLEEQDREKIRLQVTEALHGDDVERNEKGEVALHAVTYFAWTFKL